MLQRLPEPDRMGLGLACGLLLALLAVAALLAAGGWYAWRALTP